MNTVIVCLVCTVDFLLVREQSCGNEKGLHDGQGYTSADKTL